MARTQQIMGKRATPRQDAKVEASVKIPMPVKGGKKKAKGTDTEPEPLPTVLPELPASPKEFLNYLSKNKDVPMRQLMEPFLEYEAVVRQYLAQAPDHEWVKENTVNLLSVFEDGNASELTVRPRDIEKETAEETQKYIMSLKNDDRKKSGDPCIVQDLGTFKDNFAIFTESSLANLDWSNVVVAGSAVLTPLLVVPEKYKESKRTLREYYHQILAPASDIDMFIYGIDDEEAATKKMEAIEKTVQDNLLWETTTIRTRNTITIVSQYPNRHVQIVLRLYKSISQILTGFDVNCSCFAYDGKRVLANPRALAACITQCNDMDLSRRSPSYENRLSKYSKRGFEVYCPFLDRSRIDPTIFERSFGRTVGLARLLVLEALPSIGDREEYQEKRRRETERLYKPRITLRQSKNKKDYADDEVADWDFEDHSSYQKFNIPYGDGITAKQIEKLFFKKDILLNAEWNATNQPPHREVALHRHPVFIGDVKSIVEDCCGFCPEPVTEDEKQVAEEEDEVYVKGKMKMLTWLGDDPGRQEVGSFYPLGPEDYTDMAYVGSTARLCQAIIDNDADAVTAWCAQEDADANCRDFCGRTPLHLASQNRSTGIEVVRALLDAGAKIIARVQDGRTALHMAAARGASDIVEAILNKSHENEEAKDEREAKEKAAKKEGSDGSASEGDADAEAKATDDESSEAESFDNIDTVDAQSRHAKTTTTAGFVKVDGSNPDAPEFDEVDEEEEDDILDINTEDWENGMSALHYAIVGGHPNVVKTLISDFGADVRQSRKTFKYDWAGSKETDKQVLNLVLALSLEEDKRKEMLATLLNLGVSCTQSTRGYCQTETAFHAIVEFGDIEALKTVFEVDGPGASSVLNNGTHDRGYQSHPTTITPLVTAILKDAKALKNTDASKPTPESLTKYLLSKGAHAQITVADTVRHLKAKDRENLKSDKPEMILMQKVKQPIEYAIEKGLPADFIRELVNAGADYSDTLICTKFGGFGYYSREEPKMPLQGFTPLDLVRKNIKTKKTELEELKPKPLYNFWRTLDSSELENFPGDTYERYCAERAIESHSAQNYAYKQDTTKNANAEIEKANAQIPSKKAAMETNIKSLEETEKFLLELGAKTYLEKYPEVAERIKNGEEIPKENHYNYSYDPMSGHEEWVKISHRAFKINWNFNVPFLGEGDINAGYLRLFEAVWRGAPEDHEIVKSLTLGPSGEGKERLPPLRISISDQNGYTLLGVALARGNYDMIDTILEIVKEQYVPEEEEKHRFREARGGECDSDEDSDAGSESGVRFEKVEDQKDVEEFAPAQNLAKCDTSPWKYFTGAILPIQDSRVPKELKERYKNVSKNGNWSALEWAIFIEDQKLYSKLTSLAASLPTEKEKADGAGLRQYAIDQSTSYWYVPAALTMAVKLGRVDILESLMRSCTFGISYNELKKEDPTLRAEDGKKYYQGLTIRGSKQKAWVDSANPNGTRDSERVYEPLKEAISAASMPVVEWLYSERPWTCFQQFISDNAPENAVQIKLLKLWGTKQRFEFDKAMGLKTTTQLHTILRSAWDSDKSPALVRYFANKPGALEVKDDDSFTPALSAVRANRLEGAKLLLELGADFSRRDIFGKNVLHLLFEFVNAMSTAETIELWKKWLDILPAHIVQDSWTHRTLGFRLTPLAAYVNKCIHHLDLEKFRFIFEKSGGADLGFSDGKGNRLIHTLFQNRLVKPIKILLEHDRKLLDYENAVGQTPIDIAVARHFRKSHAVPVLAQNQRRNTSMFGNNQRKAKDTMKPQWGKLWKFVRAKLEGGKTGRVLCALKEANELAKRVWYLREMALSGKEGLQKMQEEEQKFDLNIVGEDGESS